MATSIRMKRTGRRNRPSYRVVVMDSRKKRDGATIEELGWYDPIRTGDNFSLKHDRIIHWLKQGAQPSDTVRSLMRKSGIAFQWHLMRQGLDEKTINQEVQKWAMDREARQKEQARVAKETLEKPEEPVDEEVGVGEETEMAQVEKESSVEPEEVVDVQEGEKGKSEAEKTEADETVEEVSEDEATETLDEEGGSKSKNRNSPGDKEDE